MIGGPLYAYNELDMEILTCLYGGGVLTRANDDKWLLIMPHKNVHTKEIRSGQAENLFMLGVIQHMHPMFERNGLDIMSISDNGKRLLGGFFKRKSRLVRQKLLFIKNAMSQESGETASMVAIYAKVITGNSNRAERKEANAQMRELIKGAGLATIWLTPFIGTGLVIAVIKLGKKFGIEMLPSSFCAKEQTDASENAS